MEGKAAAANTAVTYPPEAYEMVFLLLLIPTSAIVLLTFILPETRGHYLHQKLPPVHFWS